MNNSILQLFSPLNPLLIFLAYLIYRFLFTDGEVKRLLSKGKSIDYITKRLMIVSYSFFGLYIAIVLFQIFSLLKGISGADYAIKIVIGFLVVIGIYAYIETFRDKKRIKEMAILFDGPIKDYKFTVYDYILKTGFIIAIIGIIISMVIIGNATNSKSSLLTSTLPTPATSLTTPIEQTPTSKPLYFSFPKTSPQKPIPISDPKRIIRGPQDSRLSVWIYLDPQSPACQTMMKTIGSELVGLENKIKFEYKYLKVSASHTFSSQAIKYLYAIESKYSKGQEIMNKIYLSSNTVSNLTEEVLLNAATDAGLDKQVIIDEANTEIIDKISKRIQEDFESTSTAIEGVTKSTIRYSGVPSFRVYNNSVPVQTSKSSLTNEGMEWSELPNYLKNLKVKI
jgi:hypothetical protein